MLLPALILIAVSIVIIVLLPKPPAIITPWDTELDLSPLEDLDFGDQSPVQPEIITDELPLPRGFYDGSLPLPEVTIVTESAETIVFDDFCDYPNIPNWAEDDGC
jgi:hypothetical protein